MKMVTNPTGYMSKYFRKHKIERHFYNRKYYYSHKYLWQKNKNILGSMSTQKIYTSNIEKSKKYIHNYAEYIRHYKSNKSKTNINKSSLNQNKTDESLLNDIYETND